MPKVRSIFVSDIHLGTRACQAHSLLEFLRDYDAEHLFLLGDIIDFWAMRRGVYWSTTQNTVVQKILKRAAGFIFDFEEAVARYVKERGVDGVICGHIHSASVKEIDGIRYINCGDWVDSCTAIAEHRDGRIELIEWGARATESEPRADAAPVSLAAPKATVAVLEERRAPLRPERIRAAGADQ